MIERRGSKLFGCSYWSNGCQIIPPHDANIAASILSNLEPLSWDDNLVYHSGTLVKDVHDCVSISYKLAVENAIKFDTPHKPSIPFVYTPMHGVGLQYMNQVMEHFRLRETMTVVEEQVPLIFLVSTSSAKSFHRLSPILTSPR